MVTIASTVDEIEADTWRIRSQLGERNVFQYLLASEDRSELLLVDTGTAAMASDAIVPSLDCLGLVPEALRFIVVTHPDLDHQGGLAMLRDAAPDAVTACGFADRPMVRRPEQLLQDRYQAYLREHGIGFDDTEIAWMRANYGAPAEIDLTLCGGEELEVGERKLEIFHAPGHSAGHLMLHDLRSGILFSSDAVHHRMCPSTDGAPALCPTYEDVDAYLATIALVEALGPTEMHSGHWPAQRGREIRDFLSSSRNFVEQVDEVLSERLSQPASLAQLCEEIEHRLGPWDSGIHLLAFAIHGHLRRLLRNRAIELVDPGASPAVYRNRSSTD